MKFWTSYYGAMKNFTDDYLCVAISLYVPIIEKENFKVAREFAPDADLLKDFKSGKETQDGYKRRYVEHLFKMFTPEKLKRYIKEIEEKYSDKYDNMVFLCYEKPGDFCHRHIFAKILEIVCGIECKEIDITKNNEKTKEIALF